MRIQTGMAILPLVWSFFIGLLFLQAFLGLRESEGGASIWIALSGVVLSVVLFVAGTWVYQAQPYAAITVAVVLTLLALLFFVLYYTSDLDPAAVLTGGILTGLIAAIFIIPIFSPLEMPEDEQE